MRIIVLIKPDAVLDESDACAVEQAMRVARRRIDVRVSLLTAGPAECAIALRTALAQGADDAVHIPTEHCLTADVLLLSRVLAAAVSRLGFDLVLSGAASQEPNLSVLPAMVAERLGIPALCHADSVQFEPGVIEEIIATSDDGHEIVEVAADLPALVSLTERSAVPHHPPFPAIVEARQKLLSTLLPSHFGLDLATPASGPSAVVRETTPGHREGTIVLANEDPHNAAAQLADFLRERQFV